MRQYYLEREIRRQAAGMTFEPSTLWGKVRKLFRRPNVAVVPGGVYVGVPGHLKIGDQWFRNIPACTFLPIRVSK